MNIYSNISMASEEFPFANLSDPFGNFTCARPKIPPPVGAIIALIYVAVCLVGLLGNTLVIYVVLRFSKLQTVTNMYILNLAIADECFLIGIPFLVTTQIYSSWPFGGKMCKIYMTTIGINQFTSSIFLTIMSADRYIAVCHPITSPKLRTPMISKIVSATAWLISAVMMVPIIMYADAVQDGPNGHHSCNIIWPSNHSDSVDPQKQLQLNAFTLYSFTFSFAIPLVLIFIFYVLVIRKLQTVGPKNKSKEKKKSHRKVTKLVLTVITVYVLCWLPYWVAQLALVFQNTDDSKSTEIMECTDEVFSLFLLSHLITSLLSNANSAMNPVLYAFLSDNFKKSFWKACTCAAGKEVNATLHMENSVFPKKQNKGSERRARAPTLCPPGDEDNNEEAQLVSKGDHSTLTVTSRSNVTLSSDVTVRENGKEDGVKNGVRGSSQPTAV